MRSCDCNELRTFFVDPDFQGKGVGRKLFNAFENHAKKKGIKMIFVYGGPLAEDIYKSLGFVKKGTRVKEKLGFEYTDAYMEKVLNY